jgi:hypothetical protein
MIRALGWGIGAFAVALGLVVALPAQASAAGTDPSTGNDVSYPQCGETLPVGQAFGIVGVNDGVASTTNPCFATELTTWAALSPGTARQPSAAIYVNTGDPALKAAWWPSSNKTQSGTPVRSTHGTCKHKAGSACAYIYGYSMAARDAALPGAQSNTHWWLDVETSNTWQSSTSANAASIAGMVDYFRGHGGTVGLYSTAYQWKKIAGTTSSTSAMAGLSSWIAGASVSSAAGVCEKAGLTPRSRVSLVQYVSGHVDYDLSCGVVVAIRPTLSGTPAVGKVFTAKTAAWSPAGVKLGYQWLRNGVAISKATATTYKTTSHDAGKSLSVRVTGTASGYTTEASSSAAVRIGKVLTKTPTPRFSGTDAVGHRLTASAGHWHPGPVALHYLWRRGGVAIAGATQNKYVLTAADSGQKITLSVTGSRSGYTSVTKTSGSKTIRP